MGKIGRPAVDHIEDLAVGVQALGYEIAVLWVENSAFSRRRAAQLSRELQDEARALCTRICGTSGTTAA